MFHRKMGYSSSIYSAGWINRFGTFIKWTDIKDEYLINIYKKLTKESSRGLFHPLALSMCISNMERRNIMMNFEEPCRQMPSEQNEGKDVPTSELINFFQKKVRIVTGGAKGECGIVISIRDKNSLSNHSQLIVRNEKGTFNVDAKHVEIVKQIAVYGYQKENGEIVLSSELIKSASLKRRKMVQISDMTKYYDI